MAVDTIARGMAASAQGGSSDYSDLTNKPSINSVTLSGNKTTSDLGISYKDLTNKPVFIATYGTTTWDEVNAAYTSGQEVIAYNAAGSAYFLIEGKDSGSAYTFYRFWGGTFYRVSLSTSNSWNTGIKSYTFVESGDPVVNNSTPTWGRCMEAGTVTPSITLPWFGYPTTAQSFRYTFVAATTGATFTAPTDAMLIDKDGATTYTVHNTLTLNDLTVGNLYECSFACVRTTVSGSSRQYVVLVMKGYPLS